MVELLLIFLHHLLLTIVHLLLNDGLLLLLVLLLLEHLHLKLLLILLILVLRTDHGDIRLLELQSLLLDICLALLLRCTNWVVFGFLLSVIPAGIHMGAVRHCPSSSMAP